ncbi:MAG: AAA family ATPase [Planctomycetales bacterium]
MRITEINIDQFATWRDLRLELPQTGICVFYGPNEAGKSTLLKFIRGVLYGMPATGLVSRHSSHQSLEWSGSLGIEHDKRSCRVHRAGRIPGRGQVTISGAQEAGAPEERLKSWLSNVDQMLYEQIYALGLGELQELNTLQEGEIAARIYGLTLGPDGQRLIQSAKTIEKARQSLSHVTEPRGLIDQILADRERVQQQLRDYDKRHKQHRELCRNRSQLNSELAEREEYQKRLQGELRGHQYLQQAWGPWKRLREQRAELGKLPRIESFPERGLELLEEAEQTLKNLHTEHNRLRDESKGATTQVREMSLDRTLQAKAATVQGLLEWRPWINQIHQRIADHERESAEISKTLDEKLSRMGPAWSARRLDLTDVSPAANLRLANLSRALTSRFWLVTPRSSVLRPRRKSLRITTEDLGSAAQETGPQGSAGRPAAGGPVGKNSNCWVSCASGSATCKNECSPSTNNGNDWKRGWYFPAGCTSSWDSSRWRGLP